MLKELNFQYGAHIFQFPTKNICEFIYLFVFQNLRLFKAIFFINL